MQSSSKIAALPQIALIHVLFGVATASAQVPFPLTVTRNEARATIELPGGIGAEVTIQFEDVVGLNPAALEVEATLVNPLDPALLARLPGYPPPPPPPPPLGLPPLLPPLPPVTIPAAFPLLLRIGPTASSMLTFAGLASVSLHTHNLELDPAVPLALLKAHDGGPFVDITANEGRGSYRAGGGGGDFSEFLIVVDRRPIDEVIQGKFNALQALLVEHQGVIAPAVFDVLQQRFNQAQNLYVAGALQLAIAEMRSFSRYVSSRSGMDIPDVWRANCGGTANVAGLLRGSADTLRFSLDRKASH
jgi:hypothetical protein